jgi:hypothetical protein
MVVAVEKMHVIRRDQPNANVARHIHKCCVARFLFLHPVIVQFQKEILGAENISIFSGALFRFLDVVSLNRAVDFACKAAAQSDQTSGAFGEHLFIDSGRVMKSIQMRRRHQLHEVAIASFVLG